MALRTVHQRCSKILRQTRLFSDIAPAPDYLSKIGNREVVGYGYNGFPVYADRTDYPMPAVRFMESTPELMALREKEKGDWKNLTTEEKKTLYRASFCQTFSEMKAPTGDWKKAIGGTLFAISLGIWAFIWTKIYVYPPYPETLTDPERQEAQLRRMINLRVNPVEGVSSKWDYDKGDWKN